jgi:hypothetical protein
MMDYRVCTAALDSFREQLALSNPGDPAVAALRDQQVSDADQAPEHALLGSLVDHLIWHAASDGKELELLEEAARLWNDGRILYDSLREFRGRLEAALKDPADPANVQALNAASSAIQPLVQKVLTQLDEVQALKARVAKMSHLRPHPRQQDRPLGGWTWGDIFLARRTEAFVRETRRLANDTETSAFAFGVLSSYGANVAGSAYLGQVVGGPRRGHRFRDRVARNTVGSWVGKMDPFAPSIADLAQRLKQAFPAGLPETVRQHLEAALQATYDLGVLPPLPDLAAGYDRLVRHLELLASFVIPPAPAAPQEPFLSALFGDPAKPYVPSMPEGTGLVEAGVPGAGSGSNPGVVVPQGLGSDDGPTQQEPPASTEAKCGAFWEALGWSFLFLMGGWFACVIRWQDGDRCQLWDDITQNWEKAFPGGVEGSVELSAGQSQPLTGENLQNIAQADQILQFIGDLFNLSSLTWDGFNKAFDFLAIHGLIYPDGLLDRWRYRQFLSVPAIQPGAWPRLPDTGPRFDLYPQTGVELPAAFVFAYQPKATPAAVLARVPVVAVVSAADVSEHVWLQMARGERDSSNLDLDADRGWRHPCWTAEGSINDQPINVRTLGYDET